MKADGLSPRPVSVPVQRYAVASIYSKRCVNCGTCREVCPTDAITERQRTVCRICPTCAPKAAHAYAENDKVSLETACTIGCPLGISPQGYVNLTKLGMYDEAFQLIWKKNPLPSVCSRICHHPCEQACKRETMIDKAVAIRDTKRFLCENTELKAKKYPVTHDEEIAVIGAGPAGLSAAHSLSQAGYKVTVFEEEGVPGGMLSMAIPKFRLPREVIQADVARLEEAGLEIRYNQHIGKKQIEELKKEYDAVIVAAGTTSSRELQLDGWRKEGIFTALQFTKCVENDVPLVRHPGQEFKTDGANVVVIGGGNVALDCARTAIRMGAASVTCTCPETGDDVPSHIWEREEALEEGVKIMEGLAPVSYSGPHNLLTGVEYRKAVNFRRENGKVRFDLDDSEKIELQADIVIVAIGQAADSFWADFYEDEKIFFAGDVKTPVNSVVDALASGRTAAYAVEEKLENRPIKDLMNLRVLTQAPMSEKVYPATLPRISRPDPAMVDAAVRTGNFEDVARTYTEQEIKLETMRCMQCGYQEVDPAKCIGCGACMRECPKGDVITLVSAEEGGNEL